MYSEDNQRQPEPHDLAGPHRESGHALRSRSEAAARAVADRFNRPAAPAATRYEAEQEKGQGVALSVMQRLDRVDNHLSGLQDALQMEANARGEMDDSIGRAFEVLRRDLAALASNVGVTLPSQQTGRGSL